MSVAGRRLVCFAGSAVSIEYQGQRASQIADFLFRHLPAGDDRDITPHMTLRLSPGHNPEKLALYRNEQLLLADESEAVMAEMLLGEIGHNLADKSRGGLLFHAGALTWNGQGLLLPGSIGAGKTTLAFWLALQGIAGLEYLSDEMAFFPHGSEAMQTYTRPLNLKSPSRAALLGLFDFEGHADRMLSSPYSDLVPPELMSFAGPRGETPVSLIIFPRYTADGEFQFLPLSKAQSGLALMGCLVNARNLPGHGFSEIARLARAAPAYKLHYAGFDQIEGPIEDLLQRYRASR